MTKTEYREYIGSEGWQKRRKQYLEAYDLCERCELPRWIAALVYDQDLHVHHRSYAHVGCELDDELEALCRRCHEVETFGSSNLRKIEPQTCIRCGVEHCWDRQQRLCGECRFIEEGMFCSGPFNLLSKSRNAGMESVWRVLLHQIFCSLKYETCGHDAQESLIDVVYEVSEKSFRADGNYDAFLARLLFKEDGRNEYSNDSSEGTTE